ncbi:allophanate hydrolase-related protein [Salinispira pacifica]
MPDQIKLAVNGTLMRGLALNSNLVDADARFVREAKTAPDYRLWSIDDQYPAMIRVRQGGAAIALEVWQIPPEGLVQVLRQEPPGLCIGKVRLDDGEEVFGVLGEPALCEDRREITSYGGWREYMSEGGAAG